jgi:hypothetical protein
MGRNAADYIGPGQVVKNITLKVFLLVSNANFNNNDG